MLVSKNTDWKASQTLSPWVQLGGESLLENKIYYENGDFNLVRALSSLTAD